MLARHVQDGPLILYAAAFRRRSTPNLIHAPRQDCKTPFRGLSVPCIGTPREMLEPRTNGTSVPAGRDPGGQDIRLIAPNVELEALPDYLKRDCLLFYYPDTEDLARQIAAQSDRVELGNIKWG